MTSETLKIKEWRKVKNTLLSFLDREGLYTGDEIRDWIANCIVLFTEIGVGHNIISYFLSKLEYTEKRVELDPDPYSVSFPNHQPETKYSNESNIGPFVYDGMKGGYFLKISNRLKVKTGGKIEMTPVLVAFKVAEKIIDSYEEEERLIPKVLVAGFNREKVQGIAIALESIQTSYVKGDITNILSSVVTSTELILSLIPEVTTIRNVNKKISTIYETPSLYKKYSINPEVLWALNNSRIIRNLNIHNPSDVNHTTMYEAVGYVHLLVLLTSSLLASGEIKL